MRAPACFIFLALLVVPSGVWATPSFPEVIRQTLGAAQVPLCSVCHAGGQTRRGTVTTRFGLAMLERGLAAYDEASLKSALARMEADKVDSNGDGIPDVDALRGGTDPSRNSSAPQLEYGCAIGTGDGGWRASAPSGIVALIWLLVRRSSAPRKPRWQDRRGPRVPRGGASE
jgi:hypothetical protein